MFNSKKTQLFEMGSNKTTSVTQPFLNAGMKQAAKTLSGNGAEKFSTTGNAFVDQFGKVSNYKTQRSFNDISKDISELWSINPLMTIMFTLYLRIITRVVSLFNGTKTTTPQRGAGLKHESIMRMMWINIFHRESFWKNIQLFIAVGSWKDIITMLSYDLQYNGWKDRALDWDNFGKLILAGLENPNTTNLILKYLPQIKANSKCTTIESQADNMIAKWICSLLFGNKDNAHTYKQYRKLKVSGNAHVWQQLISKKLHNLVDFNTVPGRALSLMVSSKYLSNHGLEDKYEQWISTKPIAKFTGFVYELFKPVGKGWGTDRNLKKYQIDTINSQFKGLVETAKKGANKDTSLIVVRDTSSSMTSEVQGTGLSSYTIGKSLALFFSEMLPEGPFANSWIEFNNNAMLHQWQGSTPFEKFVNDRSESYGSTNFMGVINLFCTIKSQGVDESAFPTGIICLSDGAFDKADFKDTNVNAAKSKMVSSGFSNEYVDSFKFVFWDIPNSFYGSQAQSTKFETYGNVPNVYYFSGFDGAVVAFLTGVEYQKTAPKNAEELFEAAMNQEILNMVEV